MTSTSDESGLERVTSAVMLVAFWVAFATLAVGLALWIAVPASDAVRRMPIACAASGRTAPPSM